MKNVLENVYKASLKLLAPKSQQETYKIIVSEAMRLVGAKYGSIFLPKDGVLERVYGSSPILFNVVPRKDGNTFTAFNKRKPYILSAKEVERFHPAFKKLEVGSDISIPLSYGNITIGVLSVLSRKDVVFTQKELHTLKMFGPLATLAIRKAHLHNELLEALKVRDLFISIAAHELRTPLTTISAYTQLIATEVAKKKLPKESYTKTLSLEVIRLTKLVNELLQVDRVKKDRLQFSMKKFNFIEIIKRAIRDFYYMYPKYSIKFRNKTKNHIIRGDSDKLLQVITNLLHNAAKFSPEGSSIDVFCSETPLDFVVQISDKGQGIAKDDLPNIFDRFYKGRNSLKVGMGLGLYLVKNIIEKHKGEISVISEINKGTTFIVRLPKYNV